MMMTGLSGNEIYCLAQKGWAPGNIVVGNSVYSLGVLGGFTSGGYAVIDTDPADGQRTSGEILKRRHAERAGKVIEQLGSVDVVGDHTRTGWLPAGEMSLHARTVQTSYRPLAGPWQPPAAAARHVGWVAVSAHQQRNLPGVGWLEVIHPAISVGCHRLIPRHDGPVVYLGPLSERHGAGLALAAAQQARRPIVLAGTQPSPEATTYAEVELRPQLASRDVLLERVGPVERWELLARACCLLAPLDPEVAYSLELVEAMAYGTPVVTMLATVGVELVCHGVSGLVLDGSVLLGEAIGKASRLDPVLVREHAARRFDLPRMVDAYERLFVRLVAAGAGGR